MEAQVSVRPMVDSDFALVNAWRGDPRLSEFREETARGGLVIELGGAPVGWIDPHPAYVPAWRELAGPNVGDAPWTLDLFVAPERWNEGIGRAAIRLVSERCLAAGATSMVVDVPRSNTASSRAFRGAGWASIPTKGDDVILRYPPERPDESPHASTV